MKPFKSTELKDDAVPVFINGDLPATTKTLTDPEVAQRALDAVFHDWPPYFNKPQTSGSKQ